MVGGDMSEIESKIAEIWCGDCEYKGKCEDAPYGGGLLGLDCKRKRDAFTSLMEALIAADRAGLVEALERINSDTTLDYFEIREIAQEALAEIDSALKEGK
jgi:hypothetical protein